MTKLMEVGKFDIFFLTQDWHQNFDVNLRNVDLSSLGSVSPCLCAAKHASTSFTGDIFQTKSNRMIYCVLYVTSSVFVLNITKH